MASSEDTEITLGVGKLLGLFFLLAAICGVFFSIGYSLGRSAGREQAANDQPQVSTSADAAPAASTSGGSKPSAAVVKPQEQTSAASDSAPAQQSMTFYKAVQQNDTTTNSNIAAPKQETAPTTKEVAVSTAPKASAPAETTTPPSKTNTADVINHTSPVTGPGTIVVQIAALSREDDAVSLAGALRKKNYNVFVVNNPVNNDKFYHVQVGPFSNLADAQAMRAKLVAEGYNPIIKK